MYVVECICGEPPCYGTLLSAPSLSFCSLALITAHALWTQTLSLKYLFLSVSACSRLINALMDYRS